MAETREEERDPAGDPAQAPRQERDPAGDPAQAPGEERDPAGDPAKAPRQERDPAGDPADVPAKDKPEILIKLQERKQRHEQRGLPARVGVVVLGVILVIGGILLSGPGIPGPGFLVILVGLSFLALEFDRAERLLGKTIIWADRWKDRMEAATPRQKFAAAAVGLVLLAGFVVWAVLADIPLLPVV